MEKVKTSKASYIVFLCTLVIISINLLSLFFPVLLISVTMGSESQTNPFEVGAWTVPVLIVNLLILGFGLLYYKKRLPNKVENSFKFILNFEVSRKVAIIVII